MLNYEENNNPRESCFVDVIDNCKKYSFIQDK